MYLVRKDGMAKNITRIMYRKTNKKGILESCKGFVSKRYSTAVYHIKLDTNNLTYEIRNVMSKTNRARKFTGGNGIDGRNVKSLHYLKILVKRKLKELGVHFRTETREF